MLAVSLDFEVEEPLAGLVLSCALATQSAAPSAPVCLTFQGGTAGTEVELWGRETIDISIEEPVGRANDFLNKSEEPCIPPKFHNPKFPTLIDPIHSSRRDEPLLLLTKF